MAELELFRLTPQGVAEIKSQVLDLEKSLQNLIEAKLVAIVGVRFLATEHTTGKIAVKVINHCGDEVHKVDEV